MIGSKKQFNLTQTGERRQPSLARTRRMTTGQQTEAGTNQRSEKKDPNAMDVDALTFKERQMLMKQGKCFKCRNTGHWVTDCPDEIDRKGKKKEEPSKVDLVKNAFATIRALTKDEREAFVNMMLEGKKDF